MPADVLKNAGETLENAELEKEYEKKMKVRLTW
jgi:hypothetical protein